MLVRIRSGAVLGVQAIPVDVEVESTVGMPGFHLVGLATGAVQEAKVRVAAAVRNLGVTLPQKRGNGRGRKLRCRAARDESPAGDKVRAVGKARPPPTDR